MKTKILIDPYTKFILTIIALCLAWISMMFISRRSISLLKVGKSLGPVECLIEADWIFSLIFFSFPLIN